MSDKPFKLECTGTITDKDGYTKNFTEKDITVLTISYSIVDLPITEITQPEVWNMLQESKYSGYWEEGINEEILTKLFNKWIKEHKK